MRHDGVRRAAKPYPNAPDAHFPLIDASIDKHKPFYIQQIYANETLARFVSKKPQDSSNTSTVAAWFDYQVKQRSNFEREAISGADGLLEKGGAPVKVFWNAKRNCLEFDVCDVLHVIVPKWTEELKDADRLVHVLHLSEAQYRANKLYRQDDDFIKQIKGKGGAETGDDSGKEQEVTRREGLTCGQNDDQIVLWEIYTRDPSNWDKIIVKTRSPLKFEEAARADFQFPYNEAFFKQGWFPFTKWRGEIKDKGYYSPRGLAEIQAPFEQALTKSMNMRYQWMDFFGNPVYEQDPNHPVGNTGNHHTAPGSILPLGLKPAHPPSIPVSLGEDLNMLRTLAEYRVQAPDFGVMRDEGGKRTATEISAIGGQAQQGTDLRARIFRLDLGDTYKMAWSILLQYAKDSLVYVLHGEAKTLDASVLEDCYDISPNGSADSWNKGAQMQRAIQRWQMFRGDPHIKQGELVRSILELDDPGLVPRLFQEPQDAQASETEEQAMEISIMLMGFPASVDPPDDDKAHLICLSQYVEQTLKNQEVIEPRFARLALAHGAQHTNALMQKKDPAARQINQQLGPIIQVLGQIAAQPDPREVAAGAAQQPQNVLPMQQGTPVAGSAAPVSPTGPVAPEAQPAGAM